MWSYILQTNCHCYWFSLTTGTCTCRFTLTKSNSWHVGYITCNVYNFNLKSGWYTSEKCSCNRFDLKKSCKLLIINWILNKLFITRKNIPPSLNSFHPKLLKTQHKFTLFEGIINQIHIAWTRNLMAPTDVGEEEWSNINENVCICLNWDLNQGPLQLYS